MRRARFPAGRSARFNLLAFERAYKPAHRLSSRRAAKDVLASMSHVSDGVVDVFCGRCTP